MTSTPERFAGIRRDYTPADVEKLRGSKDAAALYAVLTEEAASHAA
jgi:isocitrate lyase